uniref:Uncharacterized protein n=1 Tax=Anopheles coluzzii TaxID=1518534 RepID=A0A8W7PQF4_ANOCL
MASARRPCGLTFTSGNFRSHEASVTLWHWSFLFCFDGTGRSASFNGDQQTLANVYGAIYPPTPSTREYFNLDGWISTIYPEAAVCGPVASIGFGV